MFELLVASGRPLASSRAWPARLVSALIHGVLVAAAVAFTRTAPPAPHYRPPEIRVFAPPDAPRPSAPAPRAPRMPGIPVTAPVPLVLTIPPEIPPPGAPPAERPWSADPVSVPGVPGTPGADPAAPSAPLEARLADEAPLLLVHPEPRYPELLRQAGITGRAVVEAVVDTAGRAEPASLRVVSADQAAFGDEARAVVLASRFRPGRLGGRPVRVRVRVPITFAIRR
jgi:protein TonB